MPEANFTWQNIAILLLAGVAFTLSLGLPDGPRGLRMTVPSEISPTVKGKRRFSGLGGDLPCNKNVVREQRVSAMMIHPHSAQNGRQGF